MKERPQILRDFEKIYKTYSLIECPKCSYKIEREHKEGEYVGLIVEKCPKCKESNMIIRSIYAVKLIEKRL